MNATNENIKPIVEDYVERVWNKKDPSALDDHLDPAVVIHSILGDFHGPEAMKKVVQTWWEGFPDLQVDNHIVLSENDIVILHWQAMGTHKGIFKNNPPSGKPVAYSGVSIYRVHHNKITEYWAYLDMQHLLSQLK